MVILPSSATNVIVVALCLTRNASGFMIPKAFPHLLAFPARSGTKLPVLSERELLSEEDAVRQATAVEALEKLRERQRAELEETDRLLELVQSKGQQGSASHQSLSTAASILSGVDYGFVSRSEGAPSKLQGGWDALGTAYGGPPSNIWSLGKNQFIRNWNAIQGEYKDEPERNLTREQIRLQAALEELTLNSTAIWEREFAHGPIEAPWIIKVPYLAVCYLLDVIFEGRYVPSRFFLLETVARMPYFSYISMLHLYETLGFWRRSADVKRIHFAEELNEYRHLLIMESLGGDQAWWVRFVAQHSAVVYYIVLCALFAISPSLSYRFSELLESHAVNTYGVFLDENEALLKQLPPTVAAIDYYSFGTSDPFYAEFQTAALASGEDLRKPGENMQNLYDVFSAIRADEGDHVSTMIACLDTGANLKSPSMERRILTAIALVVAASYFVTSVDIPTGMLDSVDVDAAAASDDATLTEMLTATLEEMLTATLDEMLTGGVGGITQKLIQDDQARDMTELAADAAKGVPMTVLEQLRRAALEIVKFLARLL